LPPFEAVDTRGSNPDNVGRLLNGAIGAYPMLARFFPPELLAFLPHFGSGCDLARYEKAKGYFGAPGSAPAAAYLAAHAGS